MEVIANDLVKFGQDIEDYQTAKQKLKESYNNFVEHVKALDSIWDGPSKKAFDNRFRNDSERALDLINQLESVYDSLNYANSEYDGCEKTIASIIDEIPV
ncbi:hypothetical protein SAMN02910292_02593 [Lachnospiraceae bacterium XBB2008]|nr:hypothetical protein SAMN02910292_02593 [Lachnospiraceae bacterium XBB2008]